MTGPEIAQILGIPEGTVRSRLRRGLDTLRRAVQDLAPSQQLFNSTAGELDGWEQRLAAGDE